MSRETDRLRARAVRHQRGEREALRKMHAALAGKAKRQRDAAPMSHAVDGVIYAWSAWSSHACAPARLCRAMAALIAARGET